MDIEKLKEKFKIPLYSFLFAMLIAVLAVLLADILYSPKTMIKRGYEIKISADGKAIKKEEKPVDLASMMKLADAARGAKIFKKCATCHSADNGGGNKVSPNLYGVINRKKAAVSGFSYSKAMLAKGGAWSRDDINQFITKPKDFVPGTKMGFAGLKEPQDRADVILYLESRR